MQDSKGKGPATQEPKGKGSASQEPKGKGVTQEPKGKCSASQEPKDKGVNPMQFLYEGFEFNNICYRDTAPFGRPHLIHLEIYARRKKDSMKIHFVDGILIFLHNYDAPAMAQLFNYKRISSFLMVREWPKENPYDKIEINRTERSVIVCGPFIHEQTT